MSVCRRSFSLQIDYACIMPLHGFVLEYNTNKCNNFISLCLQVADSGDVEAFRSAADGAEELIALAGCTSLCHQQGHCS